MKTNRLLLIGAAALLAAACASTPLEDKQDAPVTDTSASSTPATPGGDPRAVAPVTEPRHRAIR